MSTASTGAGTVVTAECLLEMRPKLLTQLYRRRVIAAGQLLLGIVRLAAAEIQVVVAGAIIDNGRVLAARRTRPAELAGKWELPGGKVRPGEPTRSPWAANSRRSWGSAAVVGDRLGPDVELGDNLVLRCYRVEIGRRPADADRARRNCLAGCAGSAFC